MACMFAPPFHSIFRKMSENSKRYSCAEGTKHGPTFNMSWLTERSDARETLERARSVSVAKHASGSSNPSGQAAEEIKKINKRLNEQEQRFSKKFKQSRRGDSESGEEKKKDGKAKGASREEEKSIKSEAVIKQEHPYRKPVPKRDSEEYKDFIKEHPPKDVKGKKVMPCWHAFANKDHGGCPFPDAKCRFYH